MGGPGSGRSPKPSEYKRLRGNPGNTPVAENPTTQRDGFPDPPEWLQGVGLAEWHRLGPEVERLGVMASVDRNAFAAYCQAYALYVNAVADLNANGFSAEGRQGSVVKNPAVQMQQQAQEQMQRWGAKLGLTPSDRARLGAVADDPSNGTDADVLKLLTGGTG